MNKNTKSIVIYTAFIVWAVIFILNQYPNLADDPGLGWHLKTGEFIIQNKTVPYFDPFLHSAKIRPWISDQWLSDLLTFEIFNFGSWPLLYAFYSLVFLSAFLLVLNTVSRKYSINLIAGLFAAVIALRLGAIHLIIRPVVLSFLLFAILYCRLLSLNKRQVLKSDFYFFTALFILWANIHPSFSIGLTVFLMFLFTKRFNRKITAIFLLSIISTFLNPYGYNLHNSILQLAGSSYFMKLNNEWKPLSFSSEEFIISLIAAFFVICDLLKNRNYKDRAFEVLTFTFFFLLIFHSIRFLPYFAIVLILPLARSINGIISVAKKEIFEINAPPVYAGITLIILSFTVFSLNPYNSTLGPESSIYPYECMKIMEGMPGKNTEKIILAHPDLGGFITFSGFKAVIDDRNTLQWEDVYKEFFENMKADNRLFSYVDKSGAKYILLKSGSDLNKFISTSSKYNRSECGNYYLLELRL